MGVPASVDGLEGVRLAEAHELARAVTPAGLNRLRVHRWGWLAHSFGPALVTWAADRLELKPGAVVLDPFAGAGTTLVTGRELGWSGIGIDLSPWATLLARTKATAPGTVSGDTLWRLAQAIGSGEAPGRVAEAPDHDLASLMFPEAIVKEAKRIAGFAADAGWGSGGILGDLVMVALSTALAGHGYFERKGGWLARAEVGAERSDPEVLRHAVVRRLTTMVEDLDVFPPPGPPALVLRGNVRDLPVASGSVDAVVTSPPYPNRHDYSRAYAAELTWLADDAAVRRFRRSHFVSQPEATVDPDAEVPVRARRAADAIEVAMREHRSRNDYVGRVLVPRMLAGYGADALASAREMARVVRPGGSVVVVVANASYSGVEYPADLVWAEALSSAGFFVDEVLVARRRAASAQQEAAGLAGERRRESVVVARA